MTEPFASIARETPDPADWTATGVLAHRVVDDAIAHLAAVLPLGPQSLEDVCTQITSNPLPYAMGNIHPRLRMWYMGTGHQRQRNQVHLERYPEIR